MRLGIIGISIKHVVESIRKMLHSSIIDDTNIAKKNGNSFEEFGIYMLNHKMKNNTKCVMAGITVICYDTYLGYREIFDF